MKLPLNLPRTRIGGFTLAEMYVALLLFSFLMAAVIAIQFFAARIYVLAATKLTSTAPGRTALNTLREQIKAADEVQVGIYNAANNTFSLISTGTQQIGNALVIYSNNPTGDNTNLGFLYFMNQQASNICRVAYSNNTVLPSTLFTNFIVYITNYYVFDAEDTYGNIMTNYDHDRVIHVKLQFCRWEFPLAGVAGQNALYDYYQLQTRASQRLIVW
jgi:type II secretory pathway pseudopilin PulG